MTVVVGVRSKSGVLLAADSQFSSPNVATMAKDSKTFSLTELVAIAYCGSGRLGQILTYHMNDVLDDPPVQMDEHEWAVRYFIEELRSVLEAQGHLYNRRGIEGIGWSAFLLAVRGRLFEVYEDFEVLENRLTFSALGSGDEVAIGAMSAIVTGRDREAPMSDAKAEEVASAGVLAATEHTSYVGGPVTSASTVNWTAEEKALARRILR